MSVVTDRERTGDDISLAALNGSHPSISLASPCLAPAALYGLAGRVVSELEPHTEADPAAILLTFLSGFGCCVGPGPHAMADGAVHPARLWPLIVGKTAKARKGSSYSQVRRVLYSAAPKFMSDHVFAGFGSGEALVDSLAASESNPRPDPRLLLVEPEFANVLSVVKREGSVLSSLLRQAWDGSKLQVRSRARTAVAPYSHVSAIGHITQAELADRMVDSDAYGGLLNRFVIVAATRSKLLASGGNLDEQVITDLGRRVSSTMTKAREVGIMRRDPDAEKVWARIYAVLADDDPDGLLGAVIARDSAQCLRFSVTYALLDGSHQIREEHVIAAAALWKYCRDSAALVFGELTGDLVADKIVRKLGEVGNRGLSRSEISELCGRHVTSARLDQAVEKLTRRGAVVANKVPTSGRPRIVIQPSLDLLTSFAVRASGWAEAETVSLSPESSRESTESDI